MSIYLDYASTTPVDKTVASQVYESMINGFGNPSSKHVYGRKARENIEKSRYEIAKTLGCLPEEIIFTSGATESNNLVIKSFDEDDFLCCSAIEHKAILNPIEAFENEKIPVNENCLLDLDYLEDLIEENEDVELCSIMLINNETGIINNIEEAFELCKEYGVLTHTDATQAFGKIPIDVKELGIDMLSLSAHKMYGPKGIGALYISNEIDKSNLIPIIEGGSQEEGLRSGTHNVPGIIGLGEAARIARDNYTRDYNHSCLLENILMAELDYLDCIEYNGCLDNKCPWILNVSFLGCDSKDVIGLIENDICVSKTSACAKNDDPSHVLLGMGLNDERCKSAIRISWGRFTTEREMRKAADLIRRAVESLQ